jgi:hypothetical protein
MYDRQRCIWAGIVGEARGEAVRDKADREEEADEIGEVVPSICREVVVEEDKPSWDNKAIKVLSR